MPMLSRSSKCQVADLVVLPHARGRAASSSRRLSRHGAEMAMDMENMVKCLKRE